MKTYDVYFRGTANLAASRLYVRSGRAAVSLASTMTGTPSAYLVARKAPPWVEVELPKVTAAFAAVVQKVGL